jgi:hypothetical protein
METTKLQGGKTNILSHGSSHILAMDMGVGAYERRSYSLLSIRRLNFFMVILAIRCRGMCKNGPKIKGLGPRIQLQTSYAHGGGCI